MNIRSSIDELVETARRSWRVVAQAAAYGFLITSSNFAAGDDTCLDYYLQEMLIRAPIGDELLWNFLDSPYYTPYQRRAQVSTEYGIEQDDWDEGWGWAMLDEDKPFIHEFPEMMNAADLLVFGLDDRLRLQGSWSAAYVGSGLGRPAALSRQPEVIDVMGRGLYDRIRHVQLSGESATWLPGYPAPARNELSIQLSVGGKKGEPYAPLGDVSLVSRSAETLDAFVRGSGRVLVHLGRTDGADWSVEVPTEDVVRSGGFRYFIDTDPVALVDAAGTIHVFAIDTQGFTSDRLIHYFRPAGQIWQAEDVSEAIGYVKSLEGQPVVINRSGNLLDVLVRSGGGLVHHSKNANRDWTAEELTPAGFAEYGLSQPTAVSRAANSLGVFAVHTASGNLLHFYWTQDAGWSIQKLGDLPGATAVEGVPAVVVRDDGIMHVFAKEYTWGHLAQFIWISGIGWTFEDISLLTGSSSLQLAPDLTATGHSRRIDVLGRGASGVLIHYYWTPEQSWQAENASAGPTTSYIHDRTDTTPVLVHRTDDVLEIIGHREPFSYRYFTSAIGPTVSSWHTNLEYWRWTRGPLHQFRYVPEVVFEGGDLPPPLEDVEAAARANRGLVVGIDDKVTVYCGSFPITPASRAAMMVHESTHMNFQVDHVENPDPNVEDDCEELCWDYWLPHAYRDPDVPLSGGIGASFWQGYSYEPTHTAYQAEIEYLCDISQFAIPAIAQEPQDPTSSPGTPGDIYLGAAGLAQTRMAKNILNPPEWTCGVPRPLP